jgi:hypothetical protein
VKVKKFISIVAILALSCAPDKDKTKPANPKVSLKGKILHASSNDTLTINTRTAVFVEQDSTMIQKRRHALGDHDFQIGLDDYAYYAQEAFNYFEKNNIPFKEARGKSFIRFVNENGATQIIRVDSLEELWTIWLFQPGKEARRADMTDIEQECRQYFTSKGG